MQSNIQRDFHSDAVKLYRSSEKRTMSSRAFATRRDSIIATPKRKLILPLGLLHSHEQNVDEVPMPVYARLKFEKEKCSPCI